MLWDVEVSSSSGQAAAVSLRIEAETWQKALETVRAQRGESTAMGTFTIELLDEGCRAVDSESRTRYHVRRHKENGLVPPRPTSKAPGPRSVPPAGASVPPPSDLKVLFQREQDATESLPLTYREYVVAAPPGTTEAAAESLLRSKLEGVRAALARVKAGKLVNLALYDAVFEGKPPVPPLVTLAWKDWQGAPVVSFPRRARAAASLPPSGPPPAAAAPRPTSKPPPAGVLAPVFEAVSVPLLPNAPDSAPDASPGGAGAPPRHALSSAPPASPAPAVKEETLTPTPGLAAAPAPAVSSSAAPPAARRLRQEDLIADLFEAMHDLHFVRDALEGGEFCLTLAMEKVPARFGVVHLYDIDRREFLVTSTRGPGAAKLLLRRHPETDPVLIAAMRRRRAIVFADVAQSSEAAALQRYRDLGGAHSLIVAPVMQAGRFLGAIELANPLDGQPFTEPEGNALMYIAEQFAQLVGSLGVITDHDLIAARALPEA